MNNIYRQVLEHKNGEIEGFASKYHCTRLVYHEGFDDVLKAISREKQLKGWRRSKKIALIESMNPRWEDLTEKRGAQMLFAGEAMNCAERSTLRKQPDTDAAAANWCENASALTKVPWRYVKVPQKGFEVLQPKHFSDLAALVPITPLSFDS